MPFRKFPTDQYKQIINLTDVKVGDKFLRNNWRTGEEQEVICNRLTPKYAEIGNIKYRLADGQPSGNYTANEHRPRLTNYPSTKHDPKLKTTISYTNWRGETSDRQITPIEIYYGSTEHHPEDGWLLKAFDHDKQAQRVFALTDMHTWE